MIMLISWKFYHIRQHDYLVAVESSRKVNFDKLLHPIPLDNLTRHIFCHDYRLQILPASYIGNELSTATRFISDRPKTTVNIL